MKHRRLALSTLILLVTQWASAGDLGFRYINGKCLNSTQNEGLNPGFFGQCGDLRNVVLGRFNLDGLDLSGTQFTNADLQQSTFNSTNLTGVSFESANLAGVEMKKSTVHFVNFQNAVLRKTQLFQSSIQNCNFSKVEMQGVDLSFTSLKSTVFRNTDLTSVNFESSDLSDSDFTGSKLIEANLKSANLSRSTLVSAELTRADLTSANLEGAKASNAVLKSATLTQANLQEALFGHADLRRALLTEAQIGSASFEEADLRGTTLENAKFNARTNFRGAVYNAKTTLPFTNEKAKDYGMVLKAGVETVLIIWDEMTPSVQTLKRGLEDEGLTVKLSRSSETAYQGEYLNEVGGVIHLNGSTYSTPMPTSSQTALVNFVKAGGTFVGTAWNGYELRNGQVSAMQDLILIDYLSGTSDVDMVNYSSNAEKRRHPVMEGIPDFGIDTCSHTLGTLRSTSAVGLMTLDGTANVAVAARELGEGRVVDLAISGNYNGGTCIAELNIRRIILNAMNWQ